MGGACVVVGLHSLQLQHAVEHGDGHEAHHYPVEEPLAAELALAIKEIAGGDQEKGEGVDYPVSRFRHNEVQSAEARELIKEVREDRHHWQQLGGAQVDVDMASGDGMQQVAVGQFVKQCRDCTQKWNYGEEFDY